MNHLFTQHRNGKSSHDKISSGLDALVKCIMLASLTAMCTVFVECKLSKKSRASSSKFRSESQNYGNLTDRQLADLLRRKGFNVHEFADAPPLVRSGDFVLYPEEVLDVADARFTSLSNTKGKLWFDNDGTARTRFVFDSSSLPNEVVFMEAVQTWKDNSCMIFNRLENANCQSRSYKPGVPTVCIGSYGSCWSNVGRSRYTRGRPQMMSVTRSGCEMVAVAHEFGHTLGANHHHSRPDRDEFITIANENFEISLGKSPAKNKPGDERSPREMQYFETCHQAEICGKDQVIFPTGILPLPYDYMSLMNYKTSTLAERHDMRPVFIAKNVEFQYMIDYHRPAGLTQSHYDSYAFNYAYKCIDQWTNNCRANGDQPPKCHNFGYIGRNCKCLCPAAYTGPTCERQITPGVLYPLLKKANLVRVQKSEKIDMGSFNYLTDKGEAVLDAFKCYQFFTIAAKGEDSSQMAVLTIIRSAPLPRLFLILAKHFVNSEFNLDCKRGIRAMWGLFSRGQCRMECISTMVRNESVGAVFRSRTNELGFYMLNRLGKIFSGSRPDLTIDMMNFQVTVDFPDNPYNILKTKDSQHEDESKEDNNADDKDDGSSERREFEHRPGASKPKTSILIWIVIAAASVLLLAGGGALCYCKFHKTTSEVFEDASVGAILVE